MTIAAAPNPIAPSTPATRTATPFLTACPVCVEPLRPFAQIKGGRLKEWFYNDRLRGLVSRLQYGRCTACGSIWAQDGRRDETLLTEIYAGLPPQYWEEMADDAAFHAGIDELLRAHAPGKRICDIGCGDGKLLRGLSDHWEKHGLEPGVKAAERCRADGIATTIGTPATAQFAEPFDVLTCMDVIEHVTDPRRELADMARMLRPGGILVILTGDPTTWTARLAGANWEYLHWVGHVSILSRAALVKLLNATGFEVLVQRTIDHTASLSAARWMRQWLRNCARRTLGRPGRRMKYCRDHQLIVARRRPRGAEG